MISGAVVFYKIASTCLLILVGYIARRMKLLPEISVSVFSKHIMYVAMPCFIIYYMPATISMDTLAANWFFPLIGVYCILGSDLFGYITARLWARPGDGGTFRQLVGLPNWVFMALAVCEPMFGDDGVRVVLLYNLAIMFYFWSFGMSSFRAGVSAKETAKQLFLNPQNIANVIGFIIALCFPLVKGMELLSSRELAAMPIWQGVITPFWETIYLCGSTALPLSIIQIGLILGEPKKEGEVILHDNRTLGLTVVLRLLVAPVISVFLLLVLCWLGVPLTENEFVISAIIMAMPAAVLCITAAEVYGGNTILAARGVLWSTVFSLATAPILTYIAVWSYQFV